MRAASSGTRWSRAWAAWRATRASRSPSPGVACRSGERRRARPAAAGGGAAARARGPPRRAGRGGGAGPRGAENVAGRERRLALHRLLSARVGALRLGAEIDGLNRRAAQGDLSSLVARAFGHRGLAMPSSPEIEAAAAWARTEHARARRLSLPRSMLARVLEVFVLLDRAVYLE